MKAKIFGILLLLESFAMLVTAAIAGYYRENDLSGFLVSAAVTGVFGLLLYFVGHRSKNTQFTMRDAPLIVTVSWLLFSTFGTLPFLISGAINNVTDAFFETMSGFSTTGATIMEDIDKQPHGILFWRSLLQWFGGLGIVVFSLAFLPSLSKNKRRTALFAAEATGVNVEKLSPTTQGTARVLWIIYMILTAMCALFYWLGPMNFFDAVCHAFTTIATGGFSTHQASIGYFNSPYVENVCVVFMTMAGINLSMYYFVVVRNFEVIRKNEEMRWYLVMILLFVVIYVLLFYFLPADNTNSEAIAARPEGAGETVRTSFFHVVALLSNTGFQASKFDYDAWGTIFVIPTVIMMIIGGCAGSTSGGIKIVRVMIMAKYIRNSVREFIHPMGIYSIKISDKTIDEAATRRVTSFFALLLVFFMLNIIALTAFGMSFRDAAVAFLSCFSNYGPGSGLTGPAFTYAAVPDPGKWILCFDMLVGRLEIFTVLVLFTKSFWKYK